MTKIIKIAILSVLSIVSTYGMNNKQPSPKSPFQELVDLSQCFLAESEDYPVKIIVGREEQRFPSVDSLLAHYRKNPVEERTNKMVVVYYRNFSPIYLSIVSVCYCVSLMEDLYTSRIKTRTTLNFLKNEYDKKHAEVTKLHRQLKGSQQLLLFKEEQLQNSNDQVKELQNALEQVKKQTKIPALDNEKLQNTIDGLNKQLTEMNDSLRHLKKDNAAAQKKLTEQSEEITKLKYLITSMRSNNQEKERRHQEEYEACQKLIEDLRATNSEIKGDNEKLSEEVVRLKAALVIAENDATQSNEYILHLMANIDAFQAPLTQRQLIDKNATLTVKNANLTVQNKELINKLNDLQQYVEWLKQQWNNSNCSKQLCKVNKNISRLTQELDYWKNLYQMHVLSNKTSANE